MARRKATMIGGHGYYIVTRRALDWSRELSVYDVAVNGGEIGQVASGHRGRWSWRLAAPGGQSFYSEMWSPTRAAAIERLVRRHVARIANEYAALQRSTGTVTR